MSVPGFTAETSLYQSRKTYRTVAASASLAQSGISPQGLCEIKCQGQYIACGAGCAAWGPLAPICVAVCLAKSVECVNKCSPPEVPQPCVNPTSCTSSAQCCTNYGFYCVNNRCVHCSTSVCDPLGKGAPCCPGYYCAGTRCQPKGTLPL